MDQNDCTAKPSSGRTITPVDVVENELKRLNDENRALRSALVRVTNLLREAERTLRLIDEADEHTKTDS